MKVCGGIAALARRLDVSVEDLVRWLRGYAAPPTTIFIRAIDLVAAGPANPVKRA
jgi:hypothetical protein